MGDKQSTEIAGTIFAVVDRRDEGSPQLVAHISEAGEIASTALSERVPDSGAEARPEPVFVFYVGFIIVVHVFGEVVLEDVERFFCKDANALISRVRWEMYVRSSRVVKKSRWSMLYNEESRQIRYLFLSLESLGMFTCNIMFSQIHPSVPAPGAELEEPLAAGLCHPIPVRICHYSVAYSADARRVR